MKLFIDEDSQSKILVSTLRSAGYDVTTVQEVGMNGASDTEVLKYASQHRRAVYSRNCGDFRRLHQNRIEPHYGIFVVHQGTAAQKNMKRKSILKALSNVQLAEIEIEDHLIELNQWVY